MSVKYRLKGLFHKKHGKRTQQTVEICKTVPLPSLFIPVKIIQLEKVYVSAMQNLKTVCEHIH